MPLQNRVTPEGDLVADPARGLLMGNRGGRIHDPATRRLVGRPWANRRWISCLPAFRGRARTVWGGGYTELFFLDEPTALAAGHRPCFECRRADARSFLAALGRLPDSAAPICADALDRRLHDERLERGRKRLHRGAAEGLPDGAFVRAGDGTPLALCGVLALPWSPAGYGEARPRPRGPVEVLTPPTVVAALRGGYRPLWHPGGP